MTFVVDKPCWVVPVSLMLLSAGCGIGGDDTRNYTVIDEQGHRVYRESHEPVLYFESRVSSHVFNVVNDTDLPLKVADISTSCGCATYDMKKKTFSPGESGKLSLDVSLPNGDMPSYSKRVYCTVSFESGMKWIYEVNFNCYRKVQFIGGRRALLGDYSEQEFRNNQDSIESNLTVYTHYLLGEPEPILTIGDLDDEMLEVQVTSEGKGEIVDDGIARKKYRLHIGFKPGAIRHGLLHGGHTRKGLVSLGSLGVINSEFYVDWSVVPDVDLSPKRISFGVVKLRPHNISQSENSSIVVLQHNGSKHVRIISVSSSSEFIIPQVIESGPGSSCSFQVAFLPLKKGGIKENCVIDVMVGDKRSKLLLPVSAIVIR